jgi:hypothetical protein
MKKALKLAAAASFFLLGWVHFLFSGGVRVSLNTKRNCIMGK